MGNLYGLAASFCAMSAPCLADRIRALAESLEPAMGLKANDPDVIKIKRALLEKAAAMDSEAASITTHSTSGRN